MTDERNQVLDLIRGWKTPPRGLVNIAEGSFNAAIPYEDRVAQVRQGREMLASDPFAQHASYRTRQGMSHGSEIGAGLTALAFMAPTLHRAGKERAQSVLDDITQEELDRLWPTLTNTQRDVVIAELADLGGPGTVIHGTVDPANPPKLKPLLSGLRNRLGSDSAGRFALQKTLSKGVSWGGALDDPETADDVRRLAPRGKLPPQLQAYADGLRNAVINAGGDADDLSPFVPNPNKVAEVYQIPLDEAKAVVGVTRAHIKHLDALGGFSVLEQEARSAENPRRLPIFQRAYEWVNEPIVRRTPHLAAQGQVQNPVRQAAKELALSALNRRSVLFPVIGGMVGAGLGLNTALRERREAREDLEEPTSFTESELRELDARAARGRIPTLRATGDLDAMLKDTRSFLGKQGPEAAQNLATYQTLLGYYAGA